MDYVDGCEVCDMLREKEKSDYVIYIGDFNTVLLNPRWSPHPGRCAIVPHDHLGEKGEYPMRHWTPDTIKEMGYLEERTKKTQEKFADWLKVDLKEREGMPLIDTIIRPGEHPNYDLIPQYDKSEQIKISGKVFPRYADSVVRSGDSDVKKTEIIIGSFSGKKKEMPKYLAEDIVRTMKDLW